jgi:dipeptidyl aminopeptidase/acylaminoacyl peptidase
VETITPLLSPELGALAISPSEQGLAAPILAVQDPRALSWSPDGQMVAFTAAFEGPSSDLYVYHLTDGRLRRLTRGFRQAATPSWSPDSQWVLVQEVSDFGGGAGWLVTNVWAVAVDHPETRSLYAPPPESGGEVILGWTGPDTVATYSWTPTGGRSVREIPLNTRWLNPILKGPFDTISFDPATRWFLFTLGDPASSEAGLVPGLYRLVANGGPPEVIQVGEWQEAEWLPLPGIFAASGAQGALILRPDGTPDGEISYFQGEGWALPSPDGLWVAAWGDERYHLRSGIRLYRPDGRMLEEVTASSTQDLAWFPDSKTFFYQTGEQIYRVSFPDTRPVLLGDDAGEGGFVMVPSGGQ